MEYAAGPAAWMIAIGGGAVVLAIALAYAILRNRTRTPAEKALTAEATRKEHREEDADHS